MFDNMDPLEIRFYLFFGFWIGLGIIFAVYTTIKKWPEEKLIKTLAPFVFIGIISGGIFLFVPEGEPLWFIMLTSMPMAILATLSYIGSMSALFELTRPVREGIERWIHKRKTGETMPDTEANLHARSESLQEDESENSDIIRSVFIILFSTVAIIVLTILKVSYP